MTPAASATIRRVAGVDGCRAGWLVASSEVDAHGAIARPELHVVSTFDAVLDMPLDQIAVDIPIGLLDVLTVGGREADRAARRLLGPLRGTSVFSAPVREVLLADSWPAPMPPNLGLTLQAWAITRKIREVDEALRSGRLSGPVVIETHPEVVFFDLNGGRAVELPKRRSAGRKRAAPSWSGSAFGGPASSLPPVRSRMTS